MSVVGVSTSSAGLMRIDMQLPDTISEARFQDGVSLISHPSSTSSEDDPTAPEKPPHPHHLKLLALSAELMRPPKTAGTKESYVVSVGLVEEARNRRRGRKERCVHWDRVEINGREFPLQRADTSIVLPAPGVGLEGASSSWKDQGSGRKSNSQGNIPDEADPSYLLVGHSMCDMCLMTFESSSISGVITMKRVLEARRDWSIASAESKKTAAASHFYGLARLCALCSQFFCTETDGIVPRGVGRSEERVSLSLESMASNKPLPDRASSAAAAASTVRGQPWSKIGGVKHRTRRDFNSVSESSTSTNFRLDQLIADDRFVVEETDLARQPGAVATQSSTADGMGADVCMGFPSFNNRHGHNDGEQGDPQRVPSSPQRCVTGSIAGTSTLATESTRTSNPLAPPKKCNAIDDPHTTTTDATKYSFGTGAKAEENSTTMDLATEVPVLSPPSRTRKARAMSLAAEAAAALAAARTCSRTRREEQPWWEVYLGGVFPVRCIRVRHPDRRTEATKAGALPYVDVAPFWIMTASGPIGEMEPKKARGVAIASKRFSSHKKVTVWDLGVNHFAASVRVQAEGVKSLQLARVEVIKGGGTRQAKDVIQQQYSVYTQQRLDAQYGSNGSVDRNGASNQSTGEATNNSSPTKSMPSKSRRVSEHTMTLRRLRRLYAERENVGEAGNNHPESEPDYHADGGPASAVTSPAVGAPGAPPSSSAQASTTPAAEMGRPGGPVISQSGFVTKVVPSMGTGGGAGAGDPRISADGPYSSVVTGWQSTTHNRPRTCPPSKGRGKKMGLSAENVPRLLLRVMVGYDWVDEFNGQEVRVRGAFTERDVGILEEIFFRCALGDDVDARAVATVSDPSLRLDPGELCGDLRRLELQVQTNTGSKNKSPMLLAIRESPYLLQLLSSGIVEALPDALARAEAQLPQELRPLSVDWTRFLGVMGLCLDAAAKGSGIVASNAVARLFEEIHDDKLDFLTRKVSRLPPARRPPHATGGGAVAKVGTVAASEMAAKRGADGRGVSRGVGGEIHNVSHDKTQSALAASAAMDGGEMISIGGSAATTAAEEGASVETGDETLDSSMGGTGAGATSRRRQGDQGTGGFAAWGRERRGRGGSSSALKSLLRPQARHEIARGYGEAMSRRRERQREALQRAPEPDLEPTRAYKSCGLCQAPFPVESLVATASLKVVESFLVKAGAPNERFERKASSVCALHRLPLCVFCSQFFDPDFPDGIVPPRGYTLKHAQTKATASAATVGASTKGDVNSGRIRSPQSALEANGLVPFFDDRFPDRWSEAPHLLSYAGESRAAGAAAGEKGWGGMSFPGGDGRTCCNKRLGVKGREARELREVGDLVRGGFSIRDRLVSERPEA